MKVLVNSCTGRVRDVVKILRCVYIRNKFRPNFSVGVYTSLSPLVTSLVSLICVLWGKKRGQRFCTLSRHRVSVEDCTFPDGSASHSCPVHIQLLVLCLFCYSYVFLIYRLCAALGEHEACAAALLGASGAAIRLRVPGLVLFPLL